jgi:putative restriction endonuclease
VSSMESLKNLVLHGHIRGVPPGSYFKSRDELKAAGLHRHGSQGGAGISGKAGEGGAEAIVLNEGYDDQDLGHTIIYTGQGGRAPGSKRYTSDQAPVRGNAALIESRSTGNPVRVIRGPKLRSDFAPEQGYRYDGLFRVVDHWWEATEDGPKVIRFRLEAIEGEDVSQVIRDSGSLSRQPERKESTVQRIVRDTKQAAIVKKIYGHHCQVCRERIEHQAGFYSEGAHIRPLGRPHAGDDHISNLLCLCPNHHTMLDYQCWGAKDDFSLIGIAGRLEVDKSHQIDKTNLAYQRSLLPPSLRK